MIMKFYAVQDLLTERFMNPALSESDAVAIRQFRSHLNNIPLWRDNSSDYDLWCLGSYDDETGKITPDMHKITNGRSVINAQIQS